MEQTRSYVGPRSPGPVLTIVQLGRRLGPPISKGPQIYNFLKIRSNANPILAVEISFVGFKIQVNLKQNCFSTIDFFLPPIFMIKEK